MKVKDIMSRSLAKTGPGDTLKEVGRFLLKHRLNSMPVVGQNDRLLGIITQADLFRTILPSQDELFREEGHWDFEKIEARANGVVGMKVENVMSKPVITVKEDTPVVKAGSTMLLKKIKQLPVVKGERLTGIVTLADIIEALIISVPKE
jgi:CBS domain-containing protein